MCQTACPLTGTEGQRQGRGSEALSTTPGRFRALVWLRRHSADERKESVGRDRSCFFTRTINATQETFNRARHPDMKRQE